MNAPLFLHRNGIPAAPDFYSETELLNQGFRFIAGVDEVGRGPLAGPVVSAAVVLNPENIPQGINDSKRLSPQRRDQLFDAILKTAPAIALASLSAPQIDHINIRQAALETMRRAVAGLALKPDFVLVDGRDVPEALACSARAIIKGDQCSLSIAAASIVAKVIRDRMMALTAHSYPQYGLASNVGYATAVHREAIMVHGPVRKLHRLTFAPLKELSLG